MLYKWLIVASYLCNMLIGIEVAKATNSATSVDVDQKTHQARAPYIDFEHLRDPFASYLASIAMRGQRLLKTQEYKLVNRKREPLEAFDLTTLLLVGIYKMGDRHVAMVQNSQGKGYVVKQGSYIGKKSGRIEKIDSDTVYVVEKILNIEGQIIDQQVTLTLKEVND